MKLITAFPIGRERTEEEKLRRHLHGDKGATFSKGKQLCLLTSGVSGCVTTFATKDCLICEFYEDQQDNNKRQADDKGMAQQGL